MQANKKKTLVRSGTKSIKLNPEKRDKKPFGSDQGTKQEDDLADSVEFGLDEVRQVLELEPSRRNMRLLQRVLDWLLRGSRAIGIELTSELASAPESVLLEMLRRAKTKTFQSGEVVYHEGEDIRSFYLVLSGRLRKRFVKRQPDKQRGEEDGEDANPIKEQVTIEYVGRGETISMPIHPDKIPFGVQASAPSTVLMISIEHYGTTLKPYHQDLCLEATEFMKQYNLVAEPVEKIHQLLRLGPLLRPRKVKRGHFLLHYTQPQTHVWILRQGVVSLQMRKESEILLAEEPRGLEPPDPLTMMLQRDTAPLETKAAEIDHLVLGERARGPFRKVLTGQKVVGGGLEGRKPSAAPGPELVTVGRLREPGTLFGEEVLLHDNEKDVLSSSSYYSAQTEEDSLFYCVDITAFKKLADILGVEQISSRIEQKLGYRRDTLQKKVGVLKKLNHTARASVARELEKMERNPTLDPALLFSHAGGDWNQSDGFNSSLVNRPVMNSGLIAGGLLCIVNGSDKLQMMREKKKFGPGVEAVMRQYRGGKDHKSMRRALLGIASNPSLRGEDNPLGDVCRASWDRPPPKMATLSRSQSLPGSKQESRDGYVFATEVILEPPSPGASSVRSLPKLQVGPKDSPPATMEEVPYEEDAEEKAEAKSRANAEAAEVKRRRLTNTFRRCVRDRSFLVLTDDTDVRSMMKRTFLSLKADVLFVKTAMELLHALSDPRQRFHVFLIDLDKPDLNIEGLLRTIRSTQRYEGAPVVAISTKRQVSDLVKTSCSYVIFKPPLADIVREATVWCLDRSVLGSEYQKGIGSSVGSPEGCASPCNAETLQGLLSSEDPKAALNVSAAATQLKAATPPTPLREGSPAHRQETPLPLPEAV